MSYQGSCHCGAVTFTVEGDVPGEAISCNCSHCRRKGFLLSFVPADKFTLDSHARLHEAIEQYLFEERRDVLRLVSSTSRPDEEARKKISAVQERLVNEYGYDDYSAEEALNYVTTLLSQE